MIRCSVCGHENDDLLVVCAFCGSYLQAKVDTLDLFQTAWVLILTPRTAFRRIVLSRHKNYGIFLTSLLGIAIAFGIFWFKNLGSHFSNLVTLLGLGIILGPPLGLIIAGVSSFILTKIGRLLGGKPSFRGMYAVVAYASIPIVLTLVFVFPVEVAIFGTYFFGNNPPPLVVNPVVYVTLLGFDALGVLWTWFLVIEGSIVANGLTRARAIVQTLSLIVITAGAAVGLHYL